MRTGCTRNPRADVRSDTKPVIVLTSDGVTPAPADGVVKAAKNTPQRYAFGS